MSRVVIYSVIGSTCGIFLFFQAEDGIRDLVRSRGLGDVYKRQLFSIPVVIPIFLLIVTTTASTAASGQMMADNLYAPWAADMVNQQFPGCLLYTSDAADERSSVDLGGRRIIKKKNSDTTGMVHVSKTYTHSHVSEQ